MLDVRFRPIADIHYRCHHGPNDEANGLRRWRKRALLVPTSLLLLAPPASLQASQPVWKKHGAWTVSALNSISGDGTSADAAVMLYQMRGDSKILVNWSQASGALRVQITIKNCYGEDEDFSQSYVIGRNRLRQLDKADLAARIREDFSTWLGQAHLSCRPQIDVTGFRLGQLRSAVADLRQWIVIFDP